LNAFLPDAREKRRISDNSRYGRQLNDVFGLLGVARVFTIEGELKEVSLGRGESHPLSHIAPSG